MFAALFLSSAKVASATSLYAAVLLGMCGMDAKRNEPPATRKATTQQARPGRAARYSAPAATRVVRLTNDSLAGQPFGEEPTVQELLATGAKVVARRPHKNLHEAGQIDTILLVRHQGNVFEFYRAPEKDLLRDATITNFQPAYGRRLRTRLEPACRSAASTTDKVRIGDTERTNYVSVIYQSGRLSAVHVEPYLD
ncbi:hypothetical protein MUN84_11155 [Hymenobacter sp. 5516J-16]|uniref:TNase-like domain-containing protein n=1 Tax=Hymenobacter sublimis TaxID=2933777 RepID=A0ABY4JC87_9BACT|nr:MULTISPECIES: hypothetical protein [Hymenobacter]UOQ79025.1 hypothetical protein MUN84_11155 [Hymenobacter sp. 5516J-16]UPL48974.1 hypothetical protein MWH26_17520 [Hymenobacter sublimis]